MMTQIIDLPNNIIFTICEYLDDDKIYEQCHSKNIVRLMQTCKRLFELLSKSNIIWKEHEVYNLYNTEFVVKIFCEFQGFKYVNQYAKSYYHFMIKWMISYSLIYIKIEYFMKCSHSNMDTFTKIYIDHSDNLRNKEETEYYLHNVQEMFDIFKDNPIIKHLYFQYSDNYDLYFYDKEFIRIFKAKNNKVVNKFLEKTSREKFLEFFEEFNERIKNF
jgi:hypothetical protein